MNQSTAELDDAALVRAAQADPDAFDALYRRHVDQVYRYCHSHVSGHLDAEDLTAQTFLAALQSLSSYDGQGSFAAWLFSIARHKCADHHRWSYANPREPLDGTYGLEDQGAIDLERRALLSSVRDCVRRSLGALTQDRREALRLRFWGGLKHQEVASVMERSEDAVKMLVWRGVRDLRRRCLDAGDKA